MNLNYSIKNKPVISTSTITSTTLPNALFYIDKKSDATTFELEINNSSLDFSSQIIETETLKTVFKVKANTSDILVTNVSIADEPYYYEVHTSDGSHLTEDEITLNSEYTITSYNGRLYTNSYIDNYEIRDGIYLHSKPTINPLTFNTKYYSDHILISVAKKKDEVLYAKTRSSNCISLTKINSNLVELSSFYLKLRSKVLQFIKGDILSVNKTEICNIESNYVLLKDKATDILGYDGYLDVFNNTIYLPDTYLSSTEVTISYKAERNSFIFEVQDEQYFKLIDNRLEVSTALDYDFKIKKVIDVTKVEVIVNPYLNKRDFGFNATDVGVQFKQLTEAQRKMFTKYINAEQYLNASECVYIQVDGRKILQSFEDTDIAIPVVSKASILKYLEDDYTAEGLAIKKTDTKVCIDDIESAYYLED